MLEFLCCFNNLRHSGALALRNAPFGQGAGPIFLDDLFCTSRERKLVNCIHRGIGVHNCVHREDAGLRCPAPPGLQLLPV